MGIFLKPFNEIYGMKGRYLMYGILTLAHLPPTFYLFGRGTHYFDREQSGSEEIGIAFYVLSALVVLHAVVMPVLVERKKRKQKLETIIES